ncbi:HXXEE domain-containing protein [Staphylococcus pettenkoferi]|uniref:HXXEE domain-containing protein n=1 Tax=Staphylococcus pettenkoferi TaxID=170573 RepID=A0A9Q4D2Z9_9STAP|nr:HXXEE domain-containing protein [Staphylococcus pettenkoferi]MCY1569965.1 HXXEE domain-containing protein [Staphylococcus pettenkoferi]MCY1594061.1 HXXEE domain-containing protein [Staphylococcus pettenkoferi]MCY1616851.1 HXXEE domain-containing protein [Staphylococcus pettenkoferi]
MLYLRNNWQYLTFLVFVGLTFYMGFWGHEQLSQIQIILMYSMIALSIHQFEEYVFPGGAPLVINKATYGEKEDYTHYPGNTLSVSIVNISAYFFYILAILFPQFIWLGLATIIFNLFQLIGHGISMNKAMGTWYNPGLASSIFLFTPISIYYIVFIHTQDLAGILTWISGIITFIIITILTVVLPVQLLKDRNSKYIISDWQIERYNAVLKHCKIK